MQQYAAFAWPTGRHWNAALFSYRWFIHVSIQVTTRWKVLKHVYQIAIVTPTCFVFKFHWSTFHWSVLGFILPHILSKKVSPISPTWSTCSIKRVRRSRRVWRKSRRVRGYLPWSPHIRLFQHRSTPRHQSVWFSFHTRGSSRIKPNEPAGLKLGEIVVAHKILWPASR